MTKKLGLYVFIVFLFAGVFSCALPYPIFQRNSNITSGDQYNINNYNETEINIEEPEVEKITVSNLNWFDTVNSLFPTYTKTRVIDIKTQKTYYVYRNGGHNHADVEPIDSKNTDIFHSLYNYEYSWVRRPVWVEINPGLWVAGSINGYPHGKSYISGNNMDGHTCIHFLLSKTHGTKRVDEAHQSCVDYAFTHGDEINNLLSQEKTD